MRKLLAVLFDVYFVLAVIAGVILLVSLPFEENADVAGTIVAVIGLAFVGGLFRLFARWLRPHGKR